MISPILSVRNIDASIVFYTTALGFELAWSMPGFACVRLGEAEVMLGTMDFVTPGGENYLGAGVQFHIDVPNPDALYQRAKAAGAEITKEIEDRPWGERAFNVKDSDGYHFMFARPLAKNA